MTLPDGRAILSRMTDRGFTLGESALGGPDPLGGPAEPMTDPEALRQRLITHRQVLEAILDRHVPNPDSTFDTVPITTAHAAVVQALLALGMYLRTEAD